MGFDNILGVGKNPGRQPAFIQASEEITESMPNTSQVTLTIQEPMITNLLEVVVNFTGSATSTPLVKLFKNGTEINRLTWQLQYDGIVSNTGKSVVYEFRQERRDFLSNGDTYTVEVSSSGGSGTITLTYSIIASGWFV